MDSSSSTQAPRIFPAFRFRDAGRMIEWLVATLGFTVHARFDNEDGTVGHAELAYGSSLIMLGQDREDEFGAIVGRAGAHTQGGKSFYIAVDDVDASFERASAAGARIEQGLTDRDYGSREFICRDPEGNVWCLGSYWPKADMTP